MIKINAPDGGSCNVTMLPNRIGSGGEQCKGRRGVPQVAPQLTEAAHAVPGGGSCAESLCIPWG
jgi:hypothetical protein